MLEEIAGSGAPKLNFSFFVELAGFCWEVPKLNPPDGNVDAKGCFWGASGTDVCCWLPNENPPSDVCAWLKKSAVGPPAVPEPKVNGFFVASAVWFWGCDVVPKLKGLLPKMDVSFGASTVFNANETGGFSSSVSCFKNGCGSFVTSSSVPRLTFPDVNGTGFVRMLWFAFGNLLIIW